MYGGNEYNSDVRGIGNDITVGVGGLYNPSGNAYRSTLGGNGTQIIQNGGDHTHTFTTGSTGDAETRPRNGVVLWVIKT